VAALHGLGLVGADLPPMVPLTGGVSSEIWRVDLPGGPVCVKRALPRLNVAGVWEAPVRRTTYEVGWMRVATAIAPAMCPTVLAEAGGAFVMTYLDPAEHHLWKPDLLAGRADPAVADAVAERLVALHAATAPRADVARAFDDPEVFAALRLAPYLEATARAHPDRADALLGARDAYLAHRTVLVHGDVSPKNLLVGPGGPVFLDAECATWGDAAFDVAFCATHLLLKARHWPVAAPGYRRCFDALTLRYLGDVDWEPVEALDARAALLLSCFLLARVDGLSPVEYLDEPARAATRAAARDLLADRPSSLEEVADRWATTL
jgi:aminoglycoside phosphotransferase (APT) family kinase protein